MYSTRWPRWMLPLAYGRAEVTRSLRGISKRTGNPESNKRGRPPGTADARICPLSRGFPVVAITEAQVQQLLEQTIDPTTGKDYVSGKEIKKVVVNGADIAVDVV